MGNPSHAGSGRSSNVADAFAGARLHIVAVTQERQALDRAQILGIIERVYQFKERFFPFTQNNEIKLGAITQTKLGKRGDVLATSHDHRLRKATADRADDAQPRPVLREHARDTDHVGVRRNATQSFVQRQAAVNVTTLLNVLVGTLGNRIQNLDVNAGLLQDRGKIGQAQRRRSRTP